MTTNSASFSARLALLLIVLMVASLACTIEFSKDGQNRSPDGEYDPGGGGSNQIASGRVPNISIREPLDGQQVPVGERVDIVVDSDSRVTGFQLNVGGQVRSTIAMPGDQIGPVTAILTWTPDRQTAYTLEVYGLNGTLISAPATLTLNAVPGGTSGESGGGAGCSGRVMVSELNFRSGPGTSTQKVGQFDAGETVTVIGRNADTSWYKIQRANAQQAWVINNAQWFTVEGTSCGSVPVTES